MLFRTEEQKKDLAGSWRRFDRSFFAAGACHVLAHEFLRRPQAGEFRPFMIVPEDGFRGSHVFASNGSVVFDYHGWSQHTQFVEHYFRKINRMFPGWRGALADISSDFWTQKWFTDTGSRQLHQYFVDPTQRANLFIDRYLHRVPNHLAQPAR